LIVAKRPASAPEYLKAGGATRRPFVIQAGRWAGGIVHAIRMSPPRPPQLRPIARHSSRPLLLASSVAYKFQVLARKHPSRQCARASLASPGPRRAGAVGRPCRAAAQIPRVPGFQFARLPPRLPTTESWPAPVDPISESPVVGRFCAPPRPDSPQSMPETACGSSSWKRWPGAESNHRHADFQSRAEF